MKVFKAGFLGEAGHWMELGELGEVGRARAVPSVALSGPELPRDLEGGAQRGWGRPSPGVRAGHCASQVSPNSGPSPGPHLLSPWEAGQLWAGARGPGVGPFSRVQAGS